MRPYQPSTKQGMPYWAVMLLVIVVAAAGVLGAVLVLHRPSPTLAPAHALPSDDPQAVTAALGAIVQLPAHETPLLISVKDSSKLSTLPFINQAKAGDVVLLYQKAQKGYLYRPRTSQLIAAGRISLQ